MPPPNALARTPSISTSVKSDSPPRVKSDVTEPGPAVPLDRQSGHRLERRPSVNCWRAAMSRRLITVTLSGMRDSG